MTANLVSHFGRWDAKPAAEYDAGEMERYTALVYVGSTYGERLPNALLDDVVHTQRPVIWVNDNILQLTRRARDFASRYGWEPPASTVRRSLRCATRGRR